jgi:GNAT superfamily N-acetyltransferase
MSKGLRREWEQMNSCHHCNQPAWYQDRVTKAFLCLAHTRLEVRGPVPSPHPGPAPLAARVGTAADLPAVLAIWKHFWAEDEMDCFGREYRAVDLDHLLVCDEDQVVGVLSYAVEREWEAINIVALNILPSHQGLRGAGKLMDMLEERARRLRIGRLLVATSNDNLPALYWYQVRGFSILDILLGAIEPNHSDDHLAGLGGIPVRDEIQLEKRL